MDRWLFRSSSGRRMPARLRCSSSATSTCSIAIRGSSCRTAATSSASSETSFGVGRRCSRAASGPSTTSSSRSPSETRSVVPSPAGRNVRSPSDERSRRRLPRHDPRLLGVDGLRRRAPGGGRGARVRLRRSRRGRRRARPPRACLSCGAALARALGSRRPSPPRSRTDPERSRRLGSRAGLRVRLRGPDRCGVGADRGPRGANGRHRVDPVRARTCGLRRARGHGRRSRSPRRGRGGGAAARGASTRTGCTRASRARALR